MMDNKLINKLITLETKLAFLDRNYDVTDIVDVTNTEKYNKNKSYFMPVLPRVKMSGSIKLKHDFNKLLIEPYDKNNSYYFFNLLENGDWFPELILEDSKYNLPCFKDHNVVFTGLSKDLPRIEIPRLFNHNEPLFELKKSSSFPGVNWLNFFSDEFNMETLHTEMISLIPGYYVTNDAMINDDLLFKIQTNYHKGEHNSPSDMYTFRVITFKMDSLPLSPMQILNSHWVSEDSVIGDFCFSEAKDAYNSIKHQIDKYSGNKNEK